MRLLAPVLILALLLISCNGGAATPPAATLPPPPTQALPTEHAPQPLAATPLPTRVRWQFGEVLPYTVQPGDTLIALAAHFNTSPEAVQQLNPDFDFATYGTLPPGQALTLPAYYAPLIGTPYHLIPDSELVASASQKHFSAKATILEYNGFLSRYSEYAEEETRPSWEIVERVARDYSISPRLLLALVEYRSGALTQPGVSDFTYPLGHRDPLQTGLHKQLVWAAEQLTRGYYGWRSGERVEVSLADGHVERLDFWQNAGTAALHTLFGALMDSEEFTVAVSPDGFGAAYHKLFGDPFMNEITIIPANLQQPDLALPFLVGKIWSYTGGPHPVWGDNTPWGALDFAPPAVTGGCGYSTEWVTAVGDGLITRSSESAVVLDLDGDGDDRTGWVMFYYHMGSDDLAAAGSVVKTGDMLGHPSCEGGRATGTHVHVARRYNGEWMPVDGPMPFVLSGWMAHVADEPYKGTLTYDFPALKIEACTCVTANNSLSR
ncbi:MAG: LysM peptidoglycan-binding domain-containing protein [Chloroflexi bacterium]|nr:LysM peptidoglycan-binding domain-containing protein [Chloroflexota bacterium]